MRRKNVQKFKSVQAEDKFKSLQAKLNTIPAKTWQTYQCTLVTPMYGGGVEAGKVDTTMPIRASSIRGQLRFWWRIACGSKDPKELFKQETAIWGGIGDDGAKASQVEIRVQTDPPINLILSEKIVAKNDKEGRGINYVLGAGDHAECLDSGFKFKISIYYHLRPNSRNALSLESLKENVMQALRWWVTFGGIGAKTRRGFGAVEIDDVEHIPATHFDNEKTNKGCRLAFANTISSQDPIYAWKIATLRLQEFRQGINIGRNKGQNKQFGRSRWPEPDQLRRLTGDWKLNHDPEHPAGNVFPRAAFGMPIIFDFNDRSNKEPNTMTLLPKGKQRMASPLIIRPYKDGEKWRAAALLLPNWEKALVEPLELSPSSSHIKPRSWPDENQQAERDRLTNHIKPMKGRPNDPLSAFLDYFKQGQ